ncbi:MAG TPA: MFS transporter [Candidatus Binataceae bacterium]|nr:MFS transporter [Candidatus Binataceae bacterium]
MAQNDSSEKIGLRPLLIYAQAQASLNLCSTLLALHLLYFYTDRMGLAPELAGLAIFGALTLDALTDPIMGNISDRARFRSGRRRPFFFAAIPMAACYYLLLAPPRLASGLFLWLFCFDFLMLTARKVYETAYSALMPELTLDYDERTRLATMRQLCATIGDVSGALLPFAAAYLFARGTDFKVSGVVCALAIALGAILVYSGLRERPEFSGRQQSRLGPAMKAAVANRPFMILLITTALAVMAINIPTVLLRFLAKYWLHDENAAASLLGAYFVGAILSYPFWFRIGSKIEKKQAFVAALVCNAVTLAAFMAVTPQNRIALMVLMGLSGFSAIGMWIAQGSASADVVEWDEERTGQRQEGAYAGLVSMAFKLAAGFSLLVIGPLMKWVGYQPGMAALAPAASEDLRLLFSIVPAAIYLIAAIVFMRYPITRAMHREMRERLAARNLGTAQ